MVDARTRCSRTNWWSQSGCFHVVTINNSAFASLTTCRWRQHQCCCGETAEQQCKYWTLFILGGVRMLDNCSSRNQTCVTGSDRWRLIHIVHGYVSTQVAPSLICLHTTLQSSQLWRLKLQRLFLNLINRQREQRKLQNLESRVFRYRHVCCEYSVKLIEHRWSVRCTITSLSKNKEICRKSDVTRLCAYANLRLRFAARRKHCKKVFLRLREQTTKETRSSAWPLTFPCCGEKGAILMEAWRNRSGSRVLELRLIIRINQVVDFSNGIGRV